MPNSPPAKKARPTIVDVHFRAAMTRRELVQAFLPGAADLARTPGLRWKIWSFNERTREFVGLYLFSGPAAAQRYIKGPVIQALREEPNLSQVEVRTFDALPSLSRHTRGPLA